MFKQKKVDRDKSPEEYIVNYIKDKSPKVVSISGASGSGKSTIAEKILEQLDNATLISVDDYLKYDRKTRSGLGITGYDWASRKVEKFEADLKKIKSGQSIDKPIFDYVNERPTDKTEKIQPKDVTIIEATLDFSKYADFRVFVYADIETLIERRLSRDIYKSTYDQESLQRYLKETSIPAYEKYILPGMDNAQIVYNTENESIYILEG